MGYISLLGGDCVSPRVYLEGVEEMKEELDKQTKPLSDDELFEIWKSVTKNMYRYCHVEFARAIEERHGIKNVQKT